MNLCSRPTVPALGLVLVMSLGMQSCVPERMSAQYQEYQRENIRLSAALESSSRELAIISQQRDEARDQLQRMKEQASGLSVQLDNLSVGHLMKSHGNHIALDGLAFRSGSDHLTAEALTAIRQLAQQLRVGAYADRQIVVVGHTDNVRMSKRQNKERYGDNWGLSAMRASRVLQALEQAGVKPHRLQGGFKGQQEPRSSNQTAQGRRSNRRVEIYLY